MSDKIKILYIDDYELDRELVKDTLEKEHGGFELTEASCKQEFKPQVYLHVRIHEKCHRPPRCPQ